MNNNKRQTIMKSGWIFIAMLSFLPWLSACADSSQQSKLPLSLPFSVEKAGDKAESELRISERQTYTFELQYFYQKDDQIERAKIWHLAGGARKDEAGKWIERGAPLQIKLKIVRRLERSEQLQFEENISNPRLSSWGNNSLEAMLANVLLDPGIYMVSAENLSDAPEFKGKKISLRIARAYLGK